MSEPRVQSVVLTDDEVVTLSSSVRCRACGHLDAMHNFHCCTFCTVVGCRCENDAVSDKNSPWNGG